MRHALLRIAFCCFFLVACGGEVTKRTAQPTAQAQATWSSMTLVERKGYMTNVVLPEMKSLFQAYDAQRYARFSCETCHGPSPERANYAMPSGHILKLHPTGSAEQKAMVAKQRGMVTFMYQKVVPKMTDLLDAEAWSDEAKTGFGCYNCHMRAESPSNAAP